MSEMHFGLVDLNLLRVFDALVEERSVTRAAARLHITPSAVSHSLGKLRALLKDQLFVRGPGGMVATARAAEIAPRLREGLHQLEMALAPVGFVAIESTRTFTVACSGYISATLLPQLMTRMWAEAPGAKLVTRSFDSGVVEELESGQVDLMIGSFGNVPDRFESALLFHDRPAWLLGRDYLLPKEPVTADRIARLPRLDTMTVVGDDVTEISVREKGLERRAALDEHSGVVGTLGDSGSEPILAAIPYTSLTPLIVKHPDLAALMPRRLATLYAQYFDLEVIEPQAGSYQMSFSSLWHREHGGNPAVAWFRGVLMEVAGAI